MISDALQYTFLLCFQYFTAPILVAYLRRVPFLIRSGSGSTRCRFRSPSRWVELRSRLGSSPITGDDPSRLGGQAFAQAHVQQHLLAGAGGEIDLINLTDNAFERLGDFT